MPPTRAATTDKTVTLTLLSANDATGTVSPAGTTTHKKGARVTISATGISPYVFTYWDDGQSDSNSATRTIELDSDTTITAYFGIG